MRQWTWLTLLAAVLLTGPTALWAAGVNAAVLGVVTLSSYVLTARLLMVAASGARQSQDVVLVGGFAGLIGGLSSELIMQVPHLSASLAVAFSSYGELGAQLYRLDVLTVWWPLVHAIGLGLLGALMGRIGFGLRR